MKTTKNNLQYIYKDLQNNLLTFEQIAKNYNISLTSLYRINNGKTFKQDRYKYPLRQGHISQQDLIIKGFISKYKEDYTPAQFTTMLKGLIDYNTIYNYYNAKNKTSYVKDANNIMGLYENRRAIFDILIAPHPEILKKAKGVEEGELNPISLHDAQYLKLMSRLNSGGKIGIENYLMLFIDEINEWFNQMNYKKTIDNKEEMK